MSNIDDAQSIAAYNAHGTALPATLATPSGYSQTNTVVSGTAFQVSTARSGYLYLNVTTSAALKVEYGPTSACAIQLSTSQSSALGLMTIQVPVGWYVKLTGTVTNYTVTTVLN